MNRSERRRNPKVQSKKNATLGNSKARASGFKISQYPILVFFLKFIGVMIPFYIFWNTAFFKDFILAPWTAFNAKIASFFLNIFGAETTAIGNMLSGPQAALEVLEGCDAIEPTMLLIAGLVAFPAPVRHTLRGILLGSLFLFGINVFRITSLYVVQVVWPAGFDFMHIEFWQVVFILLALLVWYYWIRKSPLLSKSHEESAPTPDKA